MDHNDGFAQNPEEPKPAWFQTISQFMGEDVADEILRKMKSEGVNPNNPLPFNPLMGGMNAQNNPIMQQMTALFEGSDGPINWNTAQQVANQSIINEGNDVVLSAATADVVRNQLKVADLWLDAVCELSPANSTTREVWTKKQWVAATLPAWKRLCNPVIARVTDAVVAEIKAQLERRGIDAEEMKASAAIPGVGEILSPMNPKDLLAKLGSNVFAIEIGKAMGQVAGKAFGSTDLGIPLTSHSIMGLVSANVDSYAEELEMPVEEVRQYIAVREAAHARLFNSVPWLRHHLELLLERYAETIKIDQDAVEQTIADIQTNFQEHMEGDDMEGGIKLPLGLPIPGMSGFNPEELGLKMPKNIFTAAGEDDENDALGELQALLALIEGWVDEVSTQACLPHLAQTYALRELLRRRRAVTCPIEKVLQPIIGMELSPKNALNAAKICSELQAQKGISARDEIWSHPHMVPTPEELKDPENFITNREAKKAESVEIDDELNSLLDGTLGWAEGLNPGQDSEGDNRAGNLE